MTEPKHIREEVRDYLSYNEHTGDLTWINKTCNSATIGSVAGTIKSSGYIAITLKNTKYYAHRIAWFLHTGNQPPKYIDHIDGNKLNNTWTNLREATHSENHCNIGKRTDNKSGYKGVIWDKKNSKWRAYIKKQGKYYHLGYFDNPEEAHIAYCNKADELHGNFAHY